MNNLPLFNLDDATLHDSSVTVADRARHASQPPRTRGAQPREALSVCNTAESPSTDHSFSDEYRRRATNSSGSLGAQSRPAFALSAAALLALALSSAACSDSMMVPVQRDAQTFDQSSPSDASSTDVAQDGAVPPDGTTDTGAPAADAANCPMIVGDDGTGLFPSTCNCIPNTTRACSLGPTSTVDVGACRRGVQRCIGSGEVGLWSDTCQGAVAPSAERCGNMVDDDCDGTTDEDCGCTVGTTMSCYSGPAATMGVGACRPGTRSCVAGSPPMYGACTGEVVPRAEVCGNSVDDDCDGEVDDAAVCGPGPRRHHCDLQRAHSEHR